MSKQTTTAISQNWILDGIEYGKYDIDGVKTFALKLRCPCCGFTLLSIEGHTAQYNFCPSCGVMLNNTR